MDQASIGTHDGPFRCGAALACWLLQRTERFSEAAIVLTSDESVLSALDAVVDVGGVHDPERFRYDHRAEGLRATFADGSQTGLTAAGLVYKHIGRQVVLGILGWPENHPQLDTVYRHVYRVFVESVDAEDSEMPPFGQAGPAPRFVDRTTLGSRVAALNPRWNQPRDGDIMHRQFLAAVELAGADFLSAVERVAHGWLPARLPVQQALELRHSVHASGRIMLLQETCPWNSHLHELEREYGIKGRVLFCVFRDNKDGTFRVQAVSKGGATHHRLLLPAAWRGLSGAQLCAVSGVAGCTFVHASGYIGGNATLDGAVRMAARSLRMK